MARLETHGPNGSIVIHSNVGIAQGFHCTAASLLEINEGTLILGNVFVTDIDHSYLDPAKSPSQQDFEIKKTCIGKNCMIGFGAGIQAGTQLGEHCIVGAGAVVRGIYPDYCVIAGVPARVIKRLDRATQKWVRVN